MSEKLSPKIYKGVFIALLFAFMGILTVGVSAQTTTTPLPDAAGLLQEFNRWRTAIGIRPYQEDVRLSASAQFHADDMVARNYFAHTARSPILCNGVSVSQPHERAACFDTFDGGEGIFMGRTTADEATRGWINSYGHCLGVMNPTATHLGGGNTNDVWVFQFNGVNEPNPPVQSDVFCNCTKGNSDEGHIQSCVESFNNQFNNGATPPVPPPSSLQITRRIPSDKNVTYNHQSGGGQSFGHFAPGRLTIRLVPVTGNPSGINIELADGNFTRIPDQTGIDSLVYQVTERSEFSIWFDGTKQSPGDTFYFDVLWEADYVSPTGQTTNTTDQQPQELIVSNEVAGCSATQGPEMNLTIVNNTNDIISMNWVNFECGETVYHTIQPQTEVTQGTFEGHEWVLRNSTDEALRYVLAAADNAYIVVDSAESLAAEIADEGVFTAEEEITQSDDIETVGEQIPVVEIQDSACSVTVTTVEDLIIGINNANDEVLCPGPDTIFVAEDLTVHASHDGGFTAFPNITSNITIASFNRMITRADDAPAFRFFYVDGSANHPVFTLTDIKLVNGDAGEGFDGGAVFVDARDNGRASLHTSNADFVNNTSQGNGGAILTLTFNGGEVDATLQGGVFDGNTGAYGGAFYNGGFDGGHVTLLVTNTNFINNSALIEGGAIYNNGLGNGGFAELVLNGATFTNNTAPNNETINNNGRTGGHATLNFVGVDANTSGSSVGTYSIINQGQDGYALMSWNNVPVGDANIYSCASNVGLVGDCQ